MALQQKSLREQQRANRFQEKFLKRQAAAMRGLGSPTIEPAPPPVTPSLAGADDARLDQRRSAARRFGMTRTVVGGAYGARAA